MRQGVNNKKKEVTEEELQVERMLRDIDNVTNKLNGNKRRDEEDDEEMEERKIKPGMKNTRAMLYANDSDDDEGSESEGSCDFPDY